MNRFTDRTVVVTGGGGGIGTAVCTSFAEEGAKVAVLDRDESAAASTAQAITDAGGTAIAIGCDITERSSVDAGIDHVNSEL
ncbi:MAG: SDR family NAD(P)-dependent oxidoreductase, partial [Actinomycetota bacterium]|nr:SDR family NAD(P)-dependent oxidoreductase [Actinomycetota bacterium]